MITLKEVVDILTSCGKDVEISKSPFCRYVLKMDNGNKCVLFFPSGRSFNVSVLTRVADEFSEWMTQSRIVFTKLNMNEEWEKSFRMFKVERDNEFYLLEDMLRKFSVLRF